MTDVQELIKAAQRVTYNLYVYDYAYQKALVCDTNYSYCGGAFGDALKILIGYGIPANPHTEPFDAPEVDFEFIEGVAEGYGPAASEMLKKADAVLKSFIATNEEGPNEIYNFIDNYKEAKEAWEALNLPTIS